GARENQHREAQEKQPDRCQEFHGSLFRETEKTRRKSYCKDHSDDCRGDAKIQISAGYAPARPKACSIMPRAISRSPMMTVSALSLSRYSTSSLECARATICSLMFSARERSTIWPASNPLGIATMRSRAPLMFAA